MRALCFAGMIVAVSRLIAQQPLGPSDEGVNRYSLEKEAALGKQLAADFRAQVIESAAANAYVDALGQRIIAQIPEPNFAFTFSVVADHSCPPLHEPAALPGGYVFVPAALFLTVRDEAEFAGMLARAIRHVTQRHLTRQATRGQIVKAASISLIFFGGWSGACSNDGIAVPRGFLEMMRLNEGEAESLALDTMALAGFDPRALVRYVERVHPDSTERLAVMRSAIDGLPPADYAAPTAEFAAVQQEVRRLMERGVVPKLPPTLKRRSER